MFLNENKYFANQGKNVYVILLKTVIIDFFDRLINTQRIMSISLKNNRQRKKLLIVFTFCSIFVSSITHR